MLTGQTNFLQALGWAILNSFWQIGLLWVIGRSIMSVWRDMKPAQKGSLSFVLLCAGFGWFIYTLIGTYAGLADQDPVNTQFIPVAGTSLNSWLQTSVSVASVIYLCLLIIPVSRFIRNYRYVRIIRRYGLSKISVEWRLFVTNLSAQMGIRRPVQIWISEFINSPVTIGFFKPVILVPLAAINHLSVPQMESVLLHELSHIRRHDYLFNFMINVMRTVLYFNPFVKALIRTIEKEREKSCDETVLQFQYDSHEYATALLTLEKTKFQHAAFLLAARGVHTDLLHRIESIVGVERKKTNSLRRVIWATAALAFVFLLNGILFSRQSLHGNTMGLAGNMQRSVIFKLQPPVNRSAELAAIQPEQVSRENNRPFAISAEEAKLIASNPNYIPAAFFQPVAAPVLSNEQEKQVRAAMDASKKVLENAEWKNLEKDIAEVLTTKEKAELKKLYRREMNKFDWSQWEYKLRTAYNQVDWNRVNEQLSMAVNTMRLDSLRKVYNEALCKLDATSAQISNADMKGVPDTDITLKALEEKRLEVKKALNRIQGTRTKKIVHL